MFIRLNIHIKYTLVKVFTLFIYSIVLYCTISQVDLKTQLNL